MKRILTRAVAAFAFFLAAAASTVSFAGEVPPATVLPETAMIGEETVSVDALLHNVHAGYVCRQRRGYRARMYHGRGGRHLCSYTRVRSRRGNRCTRVRSSCSYSFGYNTRNYYRCLGRRGC